MPEGDTIHLAARRIEAALGGRPLEVAGAPNPRSPLHRRTGQLEGLTVESVEARGKHLLLHLSDDLVLHSHLGMNGRWWVDTDGRAPFGRPWLVLGSGRSVAAQSQGKLLRLTSEARTRRDPGLARLGPDPLDPAFDAVAAARRLLSAQADLEVGELLLDQRVIAGIGNAIRNEACFAARISPWRRLNELSADDAERLIGECERIMQRSIESGRRPRSIYRAQGRLCPACGGPIASRGQGDANRTAYWCPRCQM